MVDENVKASRINDFTSCNVGTLGDESNDFSPFRYTATPSSNSDSVSIESSELRLSDSCSKLSAVRVILLGGPFCRLDVAAGAKSISMSHPSEASLSSAKVDIPLDVEGAAFAALKLVDEALEARPKWAAKLGEACWRIIRGVVEDEDPSSISVVSGLDVGPFRDRLTSGIRWQILQ